MAWVIEFFFTKNPKCKKRKKYIFCFLCWGGGQGVSVFFVFFLFFLFFFYKKSKSTHFFGGVEWKG